MPGGAGAIGYRYRWQSVDRVSYPGGVIRQVTLDPLQRVQRIQVGTVSEPNGILDHRYRYDPVSNIDEKDTREGRYDYGYDGLDRLTEATPPVGLPVNDTNPVGLPIERYRYDRVHNRLESDHQPGTWIYNANNELKSYGTGVERRVLSYDANGSTVREELGDPAFQVTDYVYDPQDRLIEVKRGGVTQVQYAYDPYGQRIWRETKPVSLEGATVTWFLYSTEGLIGEYRADGSLIREYGWLPNGLWGTDPVWQHDAAGTHVMHNDHLFTPERMTKAGESTVSWAGTREAFGRVAVQPGSSTTMLLRFPGQWEDGVGGFNQNWWREYGAGVGRYRSVDPIGIASGPNPKIYSRASPVRLVDNQGLFYWQPRNESDTSVRWFDQFGAHCGDSGIAAYIQCNGSGGFEIAECYQMTNCSRPCYLVHERLHIQDLMYHRPSACVGRIRGELPDFRGIQANNLERDYFLDWMECRANALQIDCILQSAAACGCKSSGDRNCCLDNPDCDCGEICRPLEDRRWQMKIHECRDIPQNWEQTPCA